MANPSPETEHFRGPATDALLALDEWNTNSVVMETVSPQPTAASKHSLTKVQVASLFRSRHSVRDFDTELDVDNDRLRLAVELAATSPSVCNRQAWKAHLYRDRVKVTEILKLQSGNAGFGHSCSGVFVITTDVGYFAGSGERNQRWVDGGMFTMSLILALHGLDIATCTLNWSRGNDASAKLRTAAEIPREEDVIALVAFGVAREGHRVARSPKRPFEQVLRIHQ